MRMREGTLPSILAWVDPTEIEIANSTAANFFNIRLLPFACLQFSRNSQGHGGASKLKGGDHVPRASRPPARGK